MEALTMRASAMSQLTRFRSLQLSQNARPLILIIDDEPAVRQVLTRFLKPLQFRVITAENGEQGMARFLQHGPVVTVIDILMPVQDGIETILQMRRHRPNANIIAMSGGGQIEGMHYLSIAVKLGANVALEKPIDTDKFLIALRTLLQPKRVALADSEGPIVRRTVGSPESDTKRPARRAPAGTKSALSASRSN
jgi:DNA-binding NtrC family response regulator